MRIKKHSYNLRKAVYTSIMLLCRFTKAEYPKCLASVLYYGRKVLRNSMVRSLKVVNPRRRKRY